MRRSKITIFLIAFILVSIVFNTTKLFETRSASGLFGFTWSFEVNPASIIGATAQVQYNLMYFLKEFVIKPIVRLIANKIQNKLINKINDIVGGLNGKGSQYITNWRNEVLGSLGRSNDIFRNTLANTTFCPHFDKQLKTVFGADLYGQSDDLCAANCADKKVEVATCKNCTNNCYKDAIQAIAATGDCGDEKANPTEYKKCIEAKLISDPVVLASLKSCFTSKACIKENLPKEFNAVQCKDKQCYFDFCAQPVQDQCKKECKTATTQNSLVPGGNPFQINANCSLDANFNPQIYAQNFAKGGGWNNWNKLFLPNNNLGGSIIIALGELAAETEKTVTAEQTERLTGSGYRSNRTVYFSKTADTKTETENVCLNACLTKEKYQEAVQGCDKEKADCDACLKEFQGSCDLAGIGDPNSQECKDYARERCTSSATVPNRCPSVIIGGGFSCASANSIKGTCNRSCQQTLKADCPANETIFGRCLFQSDVLTPADLFGKAGAKALDTHLDRFGLGAREITDIVAALLDAALNGIVDKLSNLGGEERLPTDDATFQPGTSDPIFDRNNPGQGYGISPTPIPEPIQLTLGSTCELESNSCPTNLSCVRADTGPVPIGICAQCEQDSDCPFITVGETTVQEKCGDGVCLNPSGNAAGEYCFRNNQCQTGLICGAKNKCKEKKISGDTTGTKKLGVECSAGETCGGNLFCSAEEFYCAECEEDNPQKACSNGKTCQEGVCIIAGGNEVEGSCIETLDCKQGLICDTVTKKCR